MIGIGPGSVVTNLWLSSRVPSAGAQVVEPNQVDVGAAAVFRRLQELLHAREARFTRQALRDIGQLNGLDRIDDDMPLVHPVATTHFYVRAHPDAYAAPDPAAANTFAKV